MTLGPYVTRTKVVVSPLEAEFGQRFVPRNRKNSTTMRDWNVEVKAKAKGK